MTAEEYVESVMHRKYIPHNYLDKQLKQAFEAGANSNHYGDRKKMKLRAKFKVSSVNKYDNARELVLEACIDESGDNKNWSKWTPSGTLSLYITNESTFESIDNLKYGDLYWIDITKL